MLLHLATFITLKICLTLKPILTKLVHFHSKNAFAQCNASNQQSFPKKVVKLLGKLFTASIKKI